MLSIGVTPGATDVEDLRLARLPAGPRGGGAADEGLRRQRGDLGVLQDTAAAQMTDVYANATPTFAPTDWM